jgi:hypothetical protein
VAKRKVPASARVNMKTSERDIFETCVGLLLVGRHPFTALIEFTYNIDIWR